MLQVKWLALVAIGAAASATAADVTVTLTGVKAKGGTVRVALYDERTFLRDRAPFNVTAKGEAGDLSVTFKAVPPGDYAVAAMHDADDDEKLTMVDGKLAEGTALSNAEQLRGAPTFAFAKVVVPPTGAKLSVAMSYPEDRSGW